MSTVHGLALSITCIACYVAMINQLYMHNLFCDTCRQVSNQEKSPTRFIRFMEIYRLAKFLAKFSSISLIKLGDFYHPPTLPPFSSIILKTSQEYSEQTFTLLASQHGNISSKCASHEFKSTEFYYTFTELKDLRFTVVPQLSSP